MFIRHPEAAVVPGYAPRESQPGKGAQAPSLDTLDAGHLTR